MSADDLAEWRSWRTASRFLDEEAALLDANRLDDWLALLSPDVRYSMPVRVSVMRADLAAGVVDGFSHFDEDHTSLAYRVRHVLEVDAHAEAVPSRTRRFVTNVRPVPADGVLKVRSSLLLVRSRGNDPDLGLLSAGREDVLDLRGPAPLLMERRIVVDQSTLGFVNLALFL
ncbi:MAG: hypothetical protein ABS81_10295 [Pseudonocardia sp. SCN 72-86]|nr:MAG: hypothetical protein ABS81_10295 [Pseudonocardia sp. SCN 72-86]